MTFMLVAAILFFAVALVTSFFGYCWSAVVAFIGLWMLGASGVTLIGWGVCALLVWGLGAILPKEIVESRRGTAYIFVGSVVGAILGMLMSSAGAVVGAVAGAICGGLAYGSTPDGRQLGFPSMKYFNYLAAKGFLYVVTTSIIAVGLLIIL